MGHVEPAPTESDGYFHLPTRERANPSRWMQSPAVSNLWWRAIIADTPIFFSFFPPPRGRYTCRYRYHYKSRRWPIDSDLGIETTETPPIGLPKTLLLAQSIISPSMQSSACAPLILSLSLSLDLQPFPRNDIDLVVSPLVRIAAGSSSLYISLLPVTPGRLFRDYETNGTRDSIVELSAVLFTTFALSCVIPAAQTCSNTGFRLHYALYLYTLYSFIPRSCIY